MVASDYQSVLRVFLMCLAMFLDLSIYCFIYMSQGDKKLEPNHISRLVELQLERTVQFPSSCFIIDPSLHLNAIFPVPEYFKVYKMHGDTINFL